VTETVIGLLHPGEMGAAVGRCLTRCGHTVLWASAGRGPATAARAAAAGLTDAGTAQGVAGRAGVILSVCPPHAAMDVARAVAGFGGLYVDANAVSPATAADIAAVISHGGGRYVDGGIIGLPPEAPGSTRLYLSGPHAPAVAALFAGTALEARVAGESPVAASAVKMAYAGWTKGSAALLLAVRALARAEGVEDTLLAEWAQSQPSLEPRSQGSARSATAKGWRWVAEMEEIAASMAAAGLPGGFHQAAAEIFRRTPRATAEPAATAAAGPAADRPATDGPAPGHEAAASAAANRPAAGSPAPDAPAADHGTTDHRATGPAADHPAADHPAADHPAADSATADGTPEGPAPGGQAPSGLTADGAAANDSAAAGAAGGGPPAEGGQAIDAVLAALPRR
jgi:3-hydroxyisobutyrate dehydrogenase-like beta-hydroxyacid dehydrogenase